MRYFILIVTIIIALIFLGNYAINHSVDVVILWDNIWSISLTSTTLFIIIFFSFASLYLLTAIFRFFFGLNNRIHTHQKKKLSAQAHQELTRGLLYFTEGQWQQSEKMLTDNVAYSEAPLLNYLAAARAAHMQEAYKRRDSYLTKASDQGKDTHIAVSISQAEMQYTSRQLEQARATLIHLLESYPKHPYAIKLLAKIYFEQEDWDNLFLLLPELNKQSLIKDHERNKYETTALSGIFMALAHKKDRHKMQILWKKLPADIRQKPEAVLLYCKALSTAGDTKISDKLLITTLNEDWNEKLIMRYGYIQHSNLGSAIKRAEKWLKKHENSPQLLLALARLNRKNQLWKESKVYYNKSLNISPSATVYLELAELLEELGEEENAQTCYMLGLKYSIKKQGEILNLNNH